MMTIVGTIFICLGLYGYYLLYLQFAKRINLQEKQITISEKTKVVSEPQPTEIVNESWKIGAFDQATEAIKLEIAKPMLDELLLKNNNFMKIKQDVDELHGKLTKARKEFVNKIKEIVGQGLLEFDKEYVFDDKIIKITKHRNRQYFDSTEETYELIIKERTVS